jgi:iron complex transport system substrate-binding protein
MSSDFIRKVAVYISAFVCVTAERADAIAPDSAPPSGGVVSASLCADAYVLALSEPASISALSWQVDQPVSAAPDWARQRSLAWPSAERLLELAPEHVVFGTGEGGRTAAMLSRAGVSSFELAWGDDFEAVRTNVRALGDYLGRDRAASDWIMELDLRLASLRARAESRASAPRVVYLSSSGGSAGRGTYIDAAIEAAGGVNVIATEGALGWTRSDPEFALALEADLVLTSYFIDGFSSTFNRGSRHAAYQRFLAETPRVDIASGYWPCAGPRLIDAAEAIADALDHWVDAS